MSEVGAAVDQRQRPPPAACKKESNRAISSGDGQMDSAGHGGEQSVRRRGAVGTHPEMLPRGGVS
jgi:hypothetical protein